MATPSFFFSALPLVLGWRFWLEVWRLASKCVDKRNRIGFAGIGCKAVRQVQLKSQADCRSPRFRSGRIGETFAPAEFRKARGKRWRFFSVAF